jgi:tRNA A-37 threonylcarbamoyl transferase component Bud32
VSDELYDRYLEECLAGRAEPPEVFCDRHPGAIGLRKQLEALYRLVTDSHAAEPEPAAASQGGLPFARLGEFRLIRPLAKGGMGSIYLAEQEPLGRVVALKIVREELRDSPTAAERFRREALAVARLSHPAIVGVHALGEEQGVRYIAMELVPGKALTEILAEHAGAGRTLPFRTAAKWMAEIARAAHHAHEHGVIHRDIKPSNIRVTPDGRPRLLDFGVARDERWKGKTVTEAFTGSPLYAAPEQLLGKPVDARADVYGLGATLYQCLTGRTPFDGETIEGLVTRMLVEDPVPVRRLNPGVPKDLEVVTRKALERDPARRYDSAAAVADDLEAVLESRPIRARPPGPLNIVAKWARRRPWPAAAAAALVALAVFLVAQRTVTASRRWQQSREALEEARTLLDGHAARRAAVEKLEAEMATLQVSREASHLTPEQDRLIDEREDSVAAARRAREAAHYEVLDLLRRAESLDRDAAGEADQVRATLYMEKWREARTTRQDEAAAFYRDLATKHDRAGVHTQELRGVVRIGISTDPPGAQVYLFRCVELATLVPGGDHRLVPVPLRGLPAGLVPGAFALRVMRGALAPGDLILEVAGHPVRSMLVEGTLDRVVKVGDTEVHGPYEIEHAPADAPFELAAAGRVAGPLRCLTPLEAAEKGGAGGRVFRNGAVEEMTLPEGLGLLPTAAPLYLCEAALAGTTPLEGFEVDEGLYVAVVRREGYEDRRWNFETKHVPRIEYVLSPSGSTPAGFVRVPNAWRPGSYLVMEREVTSAEYLEFLNDPATLARATETKLVPRSRDGPVFEKDASGRFALPAGWRPDFPIVGVSWEDACDYARWLTERGRREGRHGTFALPTADEWRWLVAGSTYPFGNRFRPKWISSCFGRPRPEQEPILRYPIDESRYGVFDLCGSAREWIDDWYDESRNLRRICGGSWAQGNAGAFHYFGDGYAPTTATGDTGFRLVFREDGP